MADRCAENHTTPSIGRTCGWSTRSKRRACASSRISSGCEGVDGVDGIEGVDSGLISRLLGLGHSPSTENLRLLLSAEQRPEPVAHPRRTDEAGACGSRLAG